MFDKKLLLYTALAFVCFSLWSAWQKDYAPKTEPQTVAVTEPAAEKIASIPSTSVSANVEAQTTAIQTSKLITVRTDVLEVTIDTRGGNIVKANLLKYPEKLKSSNPVELLNYEANNFYVARSGLAGQDGPDKTAKQAIYKAEKTNYTLDQGANSLTVKLVWRSPKGVNVTKLFTFDRDKYHIDVNYEISNSTNRSWVGQFFAELQKRNIAQKKGMFQFSTYTGAAISSAETPYEKMSFEKLEKEKLDRNIQGGWAAFQERYFIAVWVPDQNQPHRYFSSTDGKLISLGLSDNNLVVKPGEKAKIGSTLYIGPDSAENLQPLAKGLDRTVDYGWFWILSVGFFWLLKHINMVVGNWGWSIVIVTVLIKLAFYKPSEKSYRSMAKMKELTPKIQALKERYGDDKQKLNQAIMELYRKDKVNPLGGCLPMLIQIPFFIALYYVLMGAVELRQAPFMFWIHDLAAKDPYYIMPVLMGLSMFLQQKLSPSSPDPAQARIMMLMPVIFTVFFLSFPSGLVLYWLVNNLLSVLQQWIITKQMTASQSAV